MFGITTARRLRAELAAEKAETARQRKRAEVAEGRALTAEFNRGQALRQNADLDAANRRLMGRNIELGRRLAALAEADPEYAAALEQRIERLKKVGTRVLNAWNSELLRANHLQARLDDAVGLGSARPLDSSNWQPGYVAPKQDPKPEAAS
jgi:formate dehydrogenase maturation protein FdhE